MSTLEHEIEKAIKVAPSKEYPGEYAVWMDGVEIETSIRMEYVHRAATYERARMVATIRLACAQFSAPSPTSTDPVSYEPGSRGQMPEWRMLTEGEVIREGDEWLAHGAWYTVGNYAGQTWSNDVFLPTRRRIPAPVAKPVPMTREQAIEACVKAANDPRCMSGETLEILHEDVIAWLEGDATNRGWSDNRRDRAIAKSHEPAIAAALAIAEARKKALEEAIEAAVKVRDGFGPDRYYRMQGASDVVMALHALIK